MTFHDRLVSCRRPSSLLYEIIQPMERDKLLMILWGSESEASFEFRWHLAFCMSVSRCA
jgi:hypothetical protein